MRNYTQKICIKTDSGQAFGGGGSVALNEFNSIQLCDRRSIDLLLFFSTQLLCTAQTNKKEKVMWYIKLYFNTKLKAMRLVLNNELRSALM